VLEVVGGVSLPPVGFEPLGGPFFMLPGIAWEKIHLVHVEAPPPAALGPSAAPEHGDGSPLEEGAVLRWRPLGDALRACEAGELEDAKSELAFRRLAARLGAG
jgi:ADP-ribose pyrophosphatase